MCYLALHDQTALIDSESLEVSEENQEIPFYYHCKTCLNHCFDQDQVSLLMYMIQCTICVRPGYFITWVRPTLPKQKITRMTWMSQLSFNPVISYIM